MLATKFPKDEEGGTKLGGTIAVCVVVPALRLYGEVLLECSLYPVIVYPVVGNGAVHVTSMVVEATLVVRNPVGGGNCVVDVFVVEYADVVLS